MSAPDAILTKKGILEASPLLDSLTDAQLLSVAEHAKLISVSRGDVIWLAGSSQRFFGVVGSGFVKMMRSTASGQDVTTELMGPGQVFGLLGAIEGSGCPQTAQAVCDARYLKVDREPFIDVYNANTVLKDRLLKRTTQRLRGSYDLFAIMSTGRIEQRIAAILLSLSETYGDPVASGIEIRVPLTRQDIAEMAGTTVETAIRTLSKWQRSEWVSTHHQRTTILAQAELRKLLKTA